MLYAQSGALLRVIDGDTLLFKAEDGFDICQASFIDAPEAIENTKLQQELALCKISKEYALEAGKISKLHVEEFLKKSIPYTFEVTRILANNNPVCDIKIPKGLQVNVHPSFSTYMVRQGYALPHIIHADEHTQKEFIAFAKEAKLQKRGLWKTHHDLLMCLIYQRYSLRELRD